MTRPGWWPHFSSPLRSTAVTARVGRLLGIGFAICFVTGMLSHYQYDPWSWLPEPASPVWAYRVTQGLHVATGVACIPLLLVKLWSVYPNLFRWPPSARSARRSSGCRSSSWSSSALVQLTTGFLNTLNWYPWPWSFPSTHRYLGYVVIGSVLLHVGIKLPDIKYGLQAQALRGRRAHRDPVEREPDGAQQRRASSRRRRCLRWTGAASSSRSRPGIGVVVVTTVGQTLTPLVAHRAARHRQASKGPQGVPVNKTAEQAHVVELAQRPRLDPRGGRAAALHR